MKQMLANSVMKAVQLNIGLNFSRKYVDDAEFQNFANLLIDDVTTSNDRDEVLANARRYLDRQKNDDTYRSFAWQIATSLTGEDFPARELLLAQHSVPLLIVFTNLAIAQAFGDTATAADLEQKLGTQFE